MSDAVRNDEKLVSDLSKEEGNSTVNYYVVGAVVLAIVALLAYQMFGCPDCYAPI